MSSRRTLPVYRPATLAYCLLLLAAALTLPFARSAEASYYKMVLCGANNGANSFQTATNTASGINPSGIFSFENHCGAAPYPAGNNAFLRIAENQSVGAAGHTAYGSMSWTAPGFVSIAAGGGYTREPNAFNDGWRARFWAEGYDGSANNILVQGSGVANGSCGGVCWATTSTFASHLWPFGSYGNYRRFVFEVTCFREAGCDRANFNAADANSFQLILNDVSPAGVGFTGSSGIMAGQWVRGIHTVTWSVSDLGSGLRWERLRVDGAQRYQLDHRAGCNIDSNGATGEFARVFQPCPTGGPFAHSTLLDTASIPDGLHLMAICAQDYGQAAGLSGSGGESCNERQIRTDNRPPAAPGGLAIETSNPSRYLDRFGARWTLPPDPGSPIAKVHYEIVNAAGSVVVPEKTVAATNPTKLDAIEAPKAPGDYRLRVWLEDSVGFSGPASTVAIPHDTTPPAAPQDLSVTAPSTPRSLDGFDVRWRNITDAGSPISGAHYQVLDGAGQVVVATRDLKGDNPQSIQSLETPHERGSYTLRIWLTDAEGNVGAPATAPLAYRCVRSAVGGGLSLSAGLGDKASPLLIVPQGRGSNLSGALRGPAGAVAGAAVCVFSNVVTDTGRDFLGLAMTGRGGDYAFAIAPGASREITTMYRGDQREVEAQAMLKTRVKPTFQVRKAVVRNKRAAVFFGQIPGPHNDKVVVVLQVKSGKGWRAFRRYRTRSNGRYEVRYRFTQTRTRTRYIMRAQVRYQVGYPFEQGNSRALQLVVMP